MGKGGSTEKGLPLHNSESHIPQSMGENGASLELLMHRLQGCPRWSEIIPGPVICEWLSLL